jgi:hypothetical protein
MMNSTGAASLAPERSITAPSISGPLHDVRTGETNAQHHGGEGAGRTVNTGLVCGRMDVPLHNRTTSAPGRTMTTPLNRVPPSPGGEVLVVDASPVGSRRPSRCDVDGH